MRFSITHTTTYFYSAPARSNMNELRLAPEENSRQTPGDLRIQLEPGAELKESRDLFGNLVHFFEVEDIHDKLVIHAETEVETHSALSLAEQALTIPLPDLDNPRSDRGADDLVKEFVGDSTFVKKNPETWREAVDLLLDCDQTWGGVIKKLSDHIFDDCTYEEQLVHNMASSMDVQRDKCGTCQDFSHLFLAYARALNLPSRYVSGYLYDPGLDSESDAEFIGTGATHAWPEVHVPELGWIGIDPTNKRWVDDHYVSVSFGRDYHDVAPIRGSLIGGGRDRSLEVAVRVSAR